MTLPGGVRVSSAIAVLGLALAMSSPADAKKRKPVKCKRDQVVVRIQGKRTCRSMKQAVPKPNAQDMRVTFVSDALRVSLKGVHDRRGRSAVAPWERKGAAGRAARKAIKVIGRATPRLLAQATATRVALPRSGPGKCTEPPLQTSSSSSLGGGASATVSTGADGMSMDTTVPLPGGFTATSHVNLGAPCDGYTGASCPTADGLLEGKDRNSYDLSFVLRKGSDIVSVFASKLADSTTIKGETADDAKLDTLDLESTVDQTIVTGGSQAGYGPVTLKLRMRRHVQVDMRSGLYRPGHALVSIQVTTP